MLALLLSACTPGLGTLEVTSWGEQQALEPLPTTDGWTVTLDHWVTAYRDIELRDEKTEEVVEADGGSYVVDAVQTTDPALLATFEVPADRYVFGFSQVSPEPGATQVVPVDQAIVEAMAANGWSTWLAGSATDGATTVAFEWGLDLPSRYDNCKNGTDDTAGIAVLEGDVATAQITQHVDHAFWSALGTEEAPLEFQALADADADADGLVTREELAAVDTIDIGYETSGLADDLYEMIAFSVAQSSHVNGGGLCIVRSLE